MEIAYSATETRNELVTDIGAVGRELYDYTKPDADSTTRLSLGSIKWTASTARTWLKSRFSGYLVRGSKTGEYTA